MDAKKPDAVPTTSANARTRTTTTRTGPEKAKRGERSPPIPITPLIEAVIAYGKLVSARDKALFLVLANRKDKRAWAVMYSTKLKADVQLRLVYELSLVK